MSARHGGDAARCAVDRRIAGHPARARRAGARLRARRRLRRPPGAAGQRTRLPRDTLLNVNVPRSRPAELRGCRADAQGKRRYGDAIVEKVDPRGRKYYWIGGEDLGFVPAEGTDCTAVAGGYISVTPIHLDLTNYASIGALNELKVEWP